MQVLQAPYIIEAALPLKNMISIDALGGNTIGNLKNGSLYWGSTECLSLESNFSSSSLLQSTKSSIFL